jgi:hypothetical protein
MNHFPCYSPHPYLFFNADHTTFTFIGFNIEKKTKNLVDIQTGNILQKQTMTDELYDQLVMNKVPIQENFDELSRYVFPQDCLEM